MNKLKDIRERRCMTQRELAKASGVSQTTISFIESSFCEPIDLTKRKLANALGVPVEKVFSDRRRPKNRLREHRLKMLLTQRELAMMSDVSQVTISYIEGGLSEPMKLTKRKLANALGTSVEQLFPAPLP